MEKEMETSQQKGQKETWYSRTIQIEFQKNKYSQLKIWISDNWKMFLL